MVQRGASAYWYLADAPESVETRARLLAGWEEGGKGAGEAELACPPGPSLGSQATEEICFWSSCSPSGSPIRGWRFLSSRWYLAMREA